MDDLISRQALCDYALNQKDKSVTPNDIMRFPSAQQWVPCSERLPNTNGIYIVTRRISDGFECRNITDACYFDGSDTWHDDTRINHERKYLADVLAWCELSEPYKEEGKESVK